LGIARAASSPGATLRKVCSMALPPDEQAGSRATKDKTAR